ncbi:hypothetical protein HYQ45_009249 [Verticillium longisporum]|uniref:DNA ligase D 3'-phosphoesterase domain-containing protein n=1 Tax=Verticillium longisporum TaxID=100787 RepID=A0A8I2ZKE0_VERLO|nr:hypothetical protein HYQ45_009249 [Verticillium longisporum]RBQ89930.1 hypothetical protein VDGD_01024 [Verticillium dahliae]
MATKRPRSPGQALIPNPFIKKRNLEWALNVPEDAAQATHRQAADDSDDDDAAQPPPPTAAAIESGSATIANHAAHFSAVLAGAALDPWPRGAPRLPTAAFAALYASCLGAPSGAHFVVHQHDHPVAGTHYDLRLQINGASSASWAVMYGLPGDAGSARLGRNATETRVHCLWNHLVETASRATGSLLVWDTGTYEVLGRRSKSAPEVDPESERSEDEAEAEDGRTEQEKLRDAFAERKIRVRLHGARLPRGYTLNLRLTKEEDREGREKASRSASRAAPQRRRRRMVQKQDVIVETSEEADSSSSEKEEEEELDDAVLEAKEEVPEEESNPLAGPANMSQAMRQEIEELEDAQVRATNAYPGAENTIGSVHQRRWYLSMDRAASGFVKKRRRGGTKKLRWELEDEQTPGEDGRLTYPFHVRGPEVERSLITGRLGSDVLRDEGVVDFVGRKGWRPVLR